MLTYTYISKGKFGLAEKPNPTITPCIFIAENVGKRKKQSKSKKMAEFIKYIEYITLAKNHK